MVSEAEIVIAAKADDVFAIDLAVYLLGAVEDLMGSVAVLLALLVGGAVFWTELSGWDTLIIDYLLFALVTFVVLGGTLAQAQTRAEALGETLPDADQGWTSRKDLLFLLVAGILFLVPALAIALPLGDSGTLNAYVSFSVLEGRDFSQLLPFHPEITVFHAPGFQQRSPCGCPFAHPLRPAQTKRPSSARR